MFPEHQNMFTHPNMTPRRPRILENTRTWLNL